MEIEIRLISFFLIMNNIYEYFFFYLMNYSILIIREIIKKFYEADLINNFFQ